MKSEINENYLWDKSESDAEIEKLENLLQGFAMQESEAPILPQKTFNFQPKVSRKSFYIKFAFAASIFLAFLIGLLSFNFSKQNISDEIVRQNDAPQLLQPSEKPFQPSKKLFQTTLEQQNNAPEKIFTNLKPFKTKQKVYESSKISLKDEEREVYQIEKTVFVPKKRTEPIKKVENNQAKVVLTDEEIKAYETLKLALSITSDKLKIVKEKIDNTEQNSAENNKKADTK